MFCIGIYSGLRISDIVTLKVRDVKNKDVIRLIEQKTGNHRVYPIPAPLKRALREYCEGKALDDYVVPNLRTNKPLGRVQAWRILREACQPFGLKYIGTHTMRKTFGYRMYNGGQGATLEELRQMFNHSKEAVTRRYIGVDEELRNKHVKKLEFGGYMPQNSPQRARRRDAHGGEALETSWRHSDQHGQGPDKEPDKGQ